MRKVKVLGMAIVAVMGLGVAAPLSVGAADQDDWNIRYIPNASASVSNQYDHAYVSYYSDGFYANCTSMSGENGRRILINSDDAGGMPTISITTTGKSKTWKMKYSTTKKVDFEVQAEYGYTTTAKGIVHINN